MTKPSTTYQSLHICLVAILLGILLINIYFTVSIKQQLFEPETKETEQPTPEPPKLELFVISAINCDKCMNTSKIVEALKSQASFESTQEISATSDEGKQLITQYNITRLPTFIIRGDISSTPLAQLPGLVQQDSAYVFTQTLPPYQTIDGTIRGDVRATIILADNCDICTDPEYLLDQLTQLGILINVTKTLDAKSNDAKKLIKQYNISRLPAIIFTPDLLEYDLVKQVWSQVGTIEQDGMLALRLVVPPYTELPGKKIRGIVDLTMLTDKSCTECFNISAYQQVLAEKFKIYFATIKTYDISSEQGKKLVQKYNIAKVPTLILQGDVGAYETIKPFWEQIGSIESDGTVIFRKLELFKATHKDLTTGEVFTSGQQEDTLN